MRARTVATRMQPGQYWDNVRLCAFRANGVSCEYDVLTIVWLSTPSRRSCDSGTFVGRALAFHARLSALLLNVYKALNAV